MATKYQREIKFCVKCGEKIPETRRADAKYCSQRCRAAAEKKRYKATHPEYVKKQLRLVSELRHLKMYGHTEFLDRPELNPNDKYALARSLGFRSMLEYTIAQQLKNLEVPFTYESVKIRYEKPDTNREEFEEMAEWLENNPNVTLVLSTDLDPALKRKSQSSWQDMGSLTVMRQ